MWPDLSPGEALDRLLALDGGLRLEAYYGERSVFYNPRGVAPLGVIFASIKERDGPNDAAAQLSRAGVYAWMGWVQILSPSRASFERLAPLLAHSLDLARARWDNRGRRARH
jgi:hypothetical protein